MWGLAGDGRGGGAVFCVYVSIYLSIHPSIQLCLMVTLRTLSKAFIISHEIFVYSQALNSCTGGGRGMGGGGYSDAKGMYCTV